MGVGPMRDPLPFHRININITEKQRDFLARRAFREHTSMADIAREILEEARHGSCGLSLVASGNSRARQTGPAAFRCLPPLGATFVLRCLQRRSIVHTWGSCTACSTSQRGMDQRFSR